MRKMRERVAPLPGLSDRTHAGIQRIFNLEIDDLKIFYYVK